METRACYYVAGSPVLRTEAPRDVRVSDWRPSTRTADADGRRRALSGDKGECVSAAKVPKLLAADIDEPEHAHVVAMLAGLPPDESRFYSAGSNVIEVAGKSTVQFEALEAQYAFVAGPKEEYLAYFRRKLPERMWVWRKAEDVKAFAGFAVVAKKNGVVRTTPSDALTR